MRKIAVVVLILASFQFAAKGQSKTQSSNDKWQVFGGYTLSRQYGMVNPYSLSSSSADEYAPFNQNGGQAAVSYFPTAYFGVTYQMSFLATGDRAISGSTETVAINAQRYMIGPAFRYTLNGGTGRVTLIGHVLFGASHDTLKDNLVSNTFSSNGATIASGAGVDFRVSRHISVRPAQFDYFSKSVSPAIIGLSTSGQSLKLGVNGFDYSAGAAVNF